MRPWIAPSQFYTGIVAECYAALRGVDPDPEPYARFIASAGEPALELGCGDGDPLLKLRARGLDVAGLDSSADMIERARRRAANLGLDVVLHCAAIESMDLGRQYQSMFLAGPTFNLIVDDAVVQTALDNIARHLVDGGRVLIPLFVPSPLPAEVIGKWRSHEAGDGTRMRFMIVNEAFDEASRLQRSTLRYEVTRDGTTTSEDREWLIHWHTQLGFQAMIEAAGMRVNSVIDEIGNAATADASTFVFLANNP